MTAAQLLSIWLNARLAPDARAWLNESIVRLCNSGDDAEVYLAISLVARKIPRDRLDLTAAEMQAAEALRPGWNPRDWDFDQAARILLLLALDAQPPRLAHCLEQLCITADLRELVGFYRGLPLYPEPARYTARAAEGLRSNIKPVFTAVAHHNPYPSEQLAEAAWNQMLLKALFIDVPLCPIVGLDRRCNAELAQMLCNYAHERWAAGRSVNPELWRCVGPFARDAMIQDLERVFSQGTVTERQAAALALHVSPDPAAQLLLQEHPDLHRSVTAGELNWERLIATE